MEILLFMSTMSSSSLVRNRSLTYSRSIIALPPSTLKERLESTLLLVNPKLNWKLYILPYHVLGSFFNPYNDFFNLHTCVSNPSGYSTYTSYSTTPFKNVVLMSIWCTFHFITISRASTDLMEVYLDTGAKVSS